MSDDKSLELLDPDVALADREKKWLLDRARRAIEARLKRQKALVDESELTPMLQVERALFVTLTIGGMLRGCIGHVLPMGPLFREIGEVACLAAFDDPRFPPVSREELPHLELEVTIMSPLHHIDNVEEIIPGKHGLLVRKGCYQGLLLPQVASEHGWDRERFLSETCRKAGLPTNAWRQAGLEILVFTAYIFSDKV